MLIFPLSQLSSIYTARDQFFKSVSIVFVIFLMFLNQLCPPFPFLLFPLLGLKCEWSQNKQDVLHSIPVSPRGKNVCCSSQLSGMLFLCLSSAKLALQYCLYNAGTCFFLFAADMQLISYRICQCPQTRQRYRICVRIEKSEKRENALCFLKVAGYISTVGS